VGRRWEGMNGKCRVRNGKEDEGNGKVEKEER